MDISLLIWADPDTHAQGYQLGDIISVSLMHNEECSNARFVLVNITGVPDKAPPDVLLARIKYMLEEPESIIINISDAPTKSRRRRRAWNIKPANIPQVIRTQLLADRKITVTWIQAKPFLLKRFVVDDANPLLDNETSITDNDI